MGNKVLLLHSIRVFEKLSIQKQCHKINVQVTCHIQRNVVCVWLSSARENTHVKAIDQQARNQRKQPGNCPPEFFKNVCYLLGTVHHENISWLRLWLTTVLGYMQTEQSILCDFDIHFVLCPGLLCGLSLHDTWYVTSERKKCLTAVQTIAGCNHSTLFCD